MGCLPARHSLPSDPASRPLFQDRREGAPLPIIHGGGATAGWGVNFRAIQLPITFTFRQHELPPIKQQPSHKWGPMGSRGQDLEREFRTFFFLSCIFTKKHLNLKGEHLHWKEEAEKIVGADLGLKEEMFGIFLSQEGLAHRGWSASRWILCFCQQLVWLGGSSIPPAPRQVPKSKHRHCRMASCVQHCSFILREL